MSDDRGPWQLPSGALTDLRPGGGAAWWKSAFGEPGDSVDALGWSGVPLGYYSSSDILAVEYANEWPRGQQALVPIDHSTGVAALLDWWVPSGKPFLGLKHPKSQRRWSQVRRARWAARKHGLPLPPQPRRRWRSDYGHAAKPGGDLQVARAQWAKRFLAAVSKEIPVLIREASTP